MDFEALLKTLESHAALYAELVGAMSDDELRGEIEVFGMKMTRGSMLVNLVLCAHSAYPDAVVLTSQTNLLLQPQDNRSLPQPRRGMTV
jgi:hypothetical protein